MAVRFVRKARVVRGKVGEAMAFGTEVAAHWQETYGTTLTWGVEVGGDVGMMYWFADHADMAALEAEILASMQNEATSELLAGGIDLFEGPTTDRIVMTM